VVGRDLRRMDYVPDPKSGLLTAGPRRILRRHAPSDESSSRSPARYVDEYVRRKVNFNGAHPCELGLEKYVKRMVERLRDGMVPDESEGEAPLMPILN
jgi:hypothetical protein